MCVFFTFDFNIVAKKRYCILKLIPLGRRVMAVSVEEQRDQSLFCFIVYLPLIDRNTEIHLLFVKAGQRLFFFCKGINSANISL